MSSIHEYEKCKMWLESSNYEKLFEAKIDSELLHPPNKVTKKTNGNVHNLVRSA